MSAAAAHGRGHAPAPDCPVAYAIGGSASDASTDPSEMYLVSPDGRDEERERRAAPRAASAP